MKSGSGDDLLNELSQDEEETDNDNSEFELEDSSVDNSSETATDEADTVQKPESDPDVPYLLVRNGVKDKRDVVGIGLQNETRDFEDRLLKELEDEIGVSNLPVMDLREAAYLVGLRHAEETKEILLNWGYEHRG